MNQPNASRTRQAGAPLATESLPLVCLSHLRWRFVFQRPQHLMTRFARDRAVYFFEEPVRDGDVPRLITDQDPSGVTVVTPQIPASVSGTDVDRLLETLLAGLIDDIGAGGYVLWFQTPMAMSFAGALAPTAAIYDCMDDLASFAFAPPGIAQHEADLLASADAVFTGGRSLFEARRDRHPNVHYCPSSVDVAHFSAARQQPAEPDDLRPVPRPRIGFAGVIDERMDLGLIAALAQQRPDWHIVLVGPVAKIDPASIPNAANVHWLGPKAYAELPAYLAHWDVAMLPFAHNDATRFISPTKTPEYLAAGLPVVSTSIRDVVTPYGDLGLVHIADTPAAFVEAIDDLLQGDPDTRRAAADDFLSTQSWDRTWQFMRDQVNAAVARARRNDSPDGGTPLAAHGAVTNEDGLL
ncbi:MAG TPA: glycosyltransferase family 1 protein [Luteitalea sp.]|nr:glycosyltransferase family 1 protein [Luteitalea sp.]